MHPKKAGRSLALLLVMTMLVRAGLFAAPWAGQKPRPNTTMSDPRRDMIRALEASGPHPSLGEEARVFDRFVGSWDCDYANFEDDGKVSQSHGEVIFGWIIDGRAVQDIWTWSEKGRDERTIGTTIRFFDPKLIKWRIVWVLPEAGIIKTLIGGAVGDRIVLEGTADDGSSLRWSFNNIERDSFVWCGEKSRDGGKTWRLTGEYQLRRRNASTPVVGERQR